MIIFYSAFFFGESFSALESFQARLVGREGSFELFLSRLEKREGGIYLYEFAL